MHNIKIIADLKEHEQQRIAVLEDGKLAEIFIEYAEHNDDVHNARVARLCRDGDIFKTCWTGC